MKLNTVGGALLATLVITAAGLALTGCGSDDNTGGADALAPGSAECSGKDALIAEGSTSQ